MNEQEEFFSPNHKRLMNIATWAKYLAWVALVVYILWAISTYLQQQNIILYCNALGTAPYFGLSMLIEVAGVFLKGIIFFLVLKGISLGLNMIVETDINYKEQEAGAE